MQNQTLIKQSVENSNKKVHLHNCKQSLMMIGYAIVFSLVLTSCLHKTKSTKVHHKPNIDYHTLFGKIQGTWISYEYILNLKKTNSPAESAPFMDGIFSFTIDSTRLRDDTIHCLAWINGRQERDVWIAFDAEDSASLHNIGVKRSNDQPGLSLNENYTKIKIDSQFLTIYTNLFDSVRYVYFGELPRNMTGDYAIKYYTTAALFNGEYYTSDSNMIFGASKIGFDPYMIGRIYGSPTYDSFDININAITQNDSIDYIEFFDSKKQNESRAFKYKIKGDLLLLYSNIGQKPCVLHTIPRYDNKGSKLDQ